MEDKNNSVRPKGGFLKLVIITAIVIVITWAIGKGILTLISSVKQM